MRDSRAISDQAGPFHNPTYGGPLKTQICVYIAGRICDILTFTQNFMNDVSLEVQLELYSNLLLITVKPITCTVTYWVRPRRIFSSQGGQYNLGATLRISYNVHPAVFSSQILDPKGYNHVEWDSHRFS